MSARPGSKLPGRAQDTYQILNSPSVPHIGFTEENMSRSEWNDFVIQRMDSFDSWAFPTRQKVDQLDQEQLQSYKEAFDYFDSNHNGKVSSHNLKVCQTNIHHFQHNY